MEGNTTGAKRIRAGVPPGWSVADKTGSGDHGTTNDVAMIWNTNRSPIVLAIYFTQRDKEAPYRDQIIADATRIVMQALV